MFCRKRVAPGEFGNGGHSGCGGMQNVVNRAGHRKWWPVRHAFPLAVAAFSAACGHQVAGPPQRYAIVRFENLSGDPSLDWVGRGASEYLTRSLEARTGEVGRSDSGSISGGALTFVSTDTLERGILAFGGQTAGIPGVSGAKDASLGEGANRIVTGYVEHPTSGIRITAVEEDATTHLSVRTVSSTSGSPIGALATLSGELFSQSGTPLTNNAEAFRLYCIALEGKVEEGAPLLEQAVELDPGFGRAWGKLAQEYAAQNDTERAASVIEKARSQKLTPLDRARLDAESAVLRGDRTEAREAMRKIWALNPGDAAAGRTLAEAETADGNFGDAAKVWKRLAADTPLDANAWNQLGYTLGWSGDYNGALAAVREYARLRPNEANPFDSEGDIDYWFGKYNEAAARYGVANIKAPGFLNGGELYKSAWAKFRAGDTAGGDALFEKFKAVREKAKDVSLDLLTGDWLYRTGRRKEAVALLRQAARKAAAEQPAGIRTAIAAQLAVWDLLEGDRAAAAKDSAAGGGTSLSPVDFIVRFATMPTAPAAEWESRAHQFFASPMTARLRQPALGYALILDGKKQAAIPVWEEIVKDAGGGDFISPTVLTRLKGQKPEHLAAPDPGSVNPFASIADGI